jgi:hypothetical protein
VEQAFKMGASPYAPLVHGEKTVTHNPQFAFNGLIESIEGQEIAPYTAPIIEIFLRNGANPFVLEQREFGILSASAGDGNLIKYDLFNTALGNPLPEGGAEKVLDLIAKRAAEFAPAAPVTESFATRSSEPGQPKPRAMPWWQALLHIYPDSVI